MRGETVVARGFQPFPRFQSAPLMRGETLGASLGTRQSNFNPLPSCEGRLTRVCTQNFVYNFNPLPSCEGRLTSLRANSSSSVFQSAPLMRGETDRIAARQRHGEISIRSPHARGDQIAELIEAIKRDFNPLPSCEGRQHKPPKILLDSRQSIQQKHHSSFF